MSRRGLLRSKLGDDVPPPCFAAIAVKKPQSKREEEGEAKMKQQQQSSAVLLFFVLISVLLMAESEETGASVYIVYTRRPLEREEDLEAYHLRTLSTVLGSEQTARESLVYVYKTAACGFSAKLTPAQRYNRCKPEAKLKGVKRDVVTRKVMLMRGSGDSEVEAKSKMPEVLQVMPSQTIQLHGGVGGIH
ncbi:hypothetical protein ACLOJK_039340 [Asimina triloba]